MKKILIFLGFFLALTSLCLAEEFVTETIKVGDLTIEKTHENAKDFETIKRLQKGHDRLEKSKSQKSGSKRARLKDLDSRIKKIANDIAKTTRTEIIGQDESPDDQNRQGATQSEGQRPIQTNSVQEAGNGNKNFSQPSGDGNQNGQGVVGNTTEVTIGQAENGRARTVDEINQLVKNNKMDQLSIEELTDLLSNPEKYNLDLSKEEKTEIKKQIKNEKQAIKQEIKEQIRDLLTKPEVEKYKKLLDKEQALSISVEKRINLFDNAEKYKLSDGHIKELENSLIVQARTVLDGIDPNFITNLDKFAKNEGNVVDFIESLNKVLYDSQSSSYKKEIEKVKLIKFLLDNNYSESFENIDDIDLIRDTLINHSEDANLNKGIWDIISEFFKGLLKKLKSNNPNQYEYSLT